MLPDEPPWLTYREAAERLGITRDAVAMRARRLGWPRRPGNKPTDPVRIQIPPGEAADTAATPAASEQQAHAFRVLGEALERLNAQLDAQRALTDAERAERIEAHRQVGELRQQLEDARIAGAEQRSRVDGLQQGIDRLTGELVIARRRWWRFWE